MIMSEDTRKTPPKLREPGTCPAHAKLTSTKRTWPGPGTLSLFGSQDNPQLVAHDPNHLFSSGVYLNTTRTDLLRFAREILAFLGAGNSLPQLPPWQPANNGAGKRIWFLLRRGAETDQSLPLEDRYHFSASGVLIRYASATSAQRVADKLNAADAQTGDLAAILDSWYERYARFSRIEEDTFLALRNRLIPLQPGDPVQFQELGKTRWFNGTFEGPVDNPDDPQRSGDVTVLSKSGRRVPVFLSSVQRRA